jgi:hypothetical protein
MLLMDNVKSLLYATTLEIQTYTGVGIKIAMILPTMKDSYSQTATFNSG